MFRVPEFQEQGGEGVAFAPATPNGATNLSAEITKVFFTEGKMKSAIDRVQTARTVLGGLANNGTKITPYSTPLSKHQLPDLDLEEPYSAVHMPWLGYDVNVLCEREDTDPVIIALRARLPTLVGEVVRLLKQVQRIEAEGYVHGDIRDPNVLVDPRTGDIRIIDYGWFLPKKRFMEAYGGFGFYSNPPEYVLEFATYFSETTDGQEETMGAQAEGRVLVLSEAKQMEKYGSFDSTKRYFPWSVRDPCYMEILLAMGGEVDFNELVRRHSEILTWSITAKGEACTEAMKILNLKRFQKIVSERVTNYSERFNAHFGTEPVPEATRLATLQDALRPYFTAMIAKTPEAQVPKAKKLSTLATFDSFGLACTLRLLLWRLARDLYNTPGNSVYRMVHEVLDPLAEFRALTRKTVDEVLGVAEEIASAASAAAAVAGGRRTRRSRRNRRSRRKVHGTRIRRRLL